MGGRPSVLEKFAALDVFLGQVAYSAADKERTIDLGMKKTDTGPFVILRRNRGSLLKRPPASRRRSRH